MRKKALILAGILLAACSGYSSGAVTDSSLEQCFLNPPDSARSLVYWFWLQGNVSREGITADLEALKRVGLGGVQAFHIRRYDFGNVGYMSDEWHQLMAYTIQEADRLGLEVCFHSCAGWSSSGGPWIPPEYAMQKIVWTEKQVEGPGEFSGTLEQAPVQEATDIYHRTVDYYRDIAVVAVPTPQSECAETNAFRIENWPGKAGFNCAVGPPDTRAVDSADVIGRDQVVVLTSEMDASGKLHWKIPAGEWTLFRFGYRPTGAINAPATKEGEGLECDKLSKAAVELHWKNSVQKVLEDAGPYAGKAFSSVLIDSYERGCQNWTPGFEKEFEKRTGYSITPFLPALTGRVVDSLEISERFLWDFRKVIADMFAENYYGHLAEMCHQNGLTLSVEPYGNGNFDELAVASKVDMPMTEFWVCPVCLGQDGSSKLVSSAAHTGGKKQVGAEAFSCKPPFSEFVQHPYCLKAEGDWYYSRGVNRFVFHTYAHQPWKNVKPGMTMGYYGLQFNRNNTWFEKSVGWIDYLTRCQYLLQEGLFAADLCYLVSEDSPGRTPMRAAMVPVPPDGYDYDFCDTGTFMQMTVKDGRVHLPGGMSYSLLVLPDGNMRPAVLEKIDELVKAGAAVYGNRPQKSPSFVNYPDCDAEIKKLADGLWNDGKIISGTPLAEVLLSKSLLPDFECSGVVRDDPVAFGGKSIEHIHRKIDGADVYFVSNQRKEAVEIAATFRVNGMQPELWNPQTGKTRKTSLYSFTDDGRTVVPLSLEAAGSVFVVFRNPAEKNRVESVKGAGPFEADYESGAVVLNAMESGSYEMQKADGSKETVTAQVPEPITLNGPWTLRFPPGWGAPEQVELPELMDWSQHDNYDIRHFSGTATYLKTFNIPAERISADERLFLDLGTVCIIAQVRLNGKDMGILWGPPFRVEITDAVQPGDNRLEIEVVNLWVNRMIGDEKYPEDCEMENGLFRGKDYRRTLAKVPDWVLQGKPRPIPDRKTFSTWNFYTKDDPLLPSGLIGPVRITYAEKIRLK